MMPLRFRTRSRSRRCSPALIRKDFIHTEVKINPRWSCVNDVNWHVCQMVIKLRQWSVTDVVHEAISTPSKKLHFCACFSGSLTTPKCNPAVTWVLFPDTIPISLHQMGKFRSLSNGIEGLLLVDNYRHLQPIGNRKVFLRSVTSRFTLLEKLSNDGFDDENSSDAEDPREWYYKWFRNIFGEITLTNQ